MQVIFRRKFLIARHICLNYCIYGGLFSILHKCKLIVFLLYSKFSVFYTENRDAELSGGLGLLHTVHITVDSFYFGFGEVQFFNKSVGLCIIGSAVIKAISGVGDVFFCCGLVQIVCYEQSFCGSVKVLCPLRGSKRFLSLCSCLTCRCRIYRLQTFP